MRLRLQAAPPPTPEQLATIAERERLAHLDDLGHRLKHGRFRIRAQAAEELAMEGTAATALLCAALNDNEAEVREAAATSLGKLGDAEAVLPLCAALRHRSYSTQLAAAKALGAIGDSRALPHLLQAQNQHFGGHSARLQLLLTPMLLAVGLIVTALHLATGFPDRGTSFTVFLVYMVVQSPLSLLSQRVTESALCGEAIEAIARIAERDPHPSLHRLIPELRAISSNRLGHNKATRATATAAAERLESLTARFRDLPLPAQPTTEPPENRPLPVYPNSSSEH